MLLNPLKTRPTSRLGFPVMRGAFPFLGHLPVLATDSLGFIRRAEQELGPHFWVEAGFGVQMLQCLSPDVFTIFKNRVTTSTYMQEMVGPLFGGSLIVHDGEVHQHMRSAMNAPFQPRGLSDAGVGDIVGSIIERRVRSWAGRDVQILSETRELALEAMFRIVGITDPDLTAWRRHYEDLALLAINFPVDFPGSPMRRGLAARGWLDARLRTIVRDAQANERDTSLLGSLAHARDEAGRELAEQELIDNLRLLLLAGHETSASTMAWLTTIVARRPDVWEKLREEADAAGGIPRSPREARAFPYAEAVFRETLRLYPPVASDARRAVVDFELGGRRIPKGTDVGISIVCLSRSSALYERPDEFYPERWLGREQAPSAIELVQFGGGPHFCLGYHLAWLELVQFAVTLALELGKRGQKPRLTSRPPEMRYMPLLHPSTGTRVAFS
jgi:cytochrome P450